MIIMVFSGALPAVMLAIALWFTRGKNNYANRILSLFLLFNAGYLLALIPFHGGYTQQYNALQLMMLLVFINGPLLYTYARAMTDSKYRIHCHHIIHLLPVVVIASMIFWCNHCVQRFYAIVGIFYYIQLTGYLIAAFYHLPKYPESNESQDSWQERVNIHWLRRLLGICLVVAIIGLVIAVARVTSHYQFWPRAIFSASLIMMVYYIIALMAIIEPAIFNQKPSLLSTVAVLNTSTTSTKGLDKPDKEPQYLTSNLSAANIDQYMQRLEHYMRSQKPYLQNKLRLCDLAVTIDLSTHQLSQIINQSSGKNFFEYINEYRIDEAKRLLKTQALLNINQIALESGFNSQSAFYKQFKKLVGITPKQYKASLDN